MSFAIYVNSNLSSASGGNSAPKSSDASTDESKFINDFYGLVDQDESKTSGAPIKRSVNYDSQSMQTGFVICKPSASTNPSAMADRY